MLFYRFFLALLLISLIPIATNIFQLYQSQQVIEEKVDQELISVAESIQSEVNSWVDTTLAISRLLSNSNQVKAGTTEEKVSVLKNALDTLEWTYLVFATDDRGFSVARSDAKDAKDYSDRSYFKEVMAGQTIGQQVLISRTNGQPAMCMSIPIIDQSSIQGALVQCSTLLSISEAIADRRIGQTGYVRLIDSKNRLIAHGDPNEVREGLVDLQGDAINAAGLTRKPVTVDLSSKKVITYSVETNLGWKINVVQDYKEAYAALIDGRRFGLIALGIVLSTVLLVAFLLGKSISKPVQQLARAADLFSRGELGAKIPGQQRKDEIGDLSRAVARLGNSFKIIAKRYSLIQKERKSS